MNFNLKAAQGILVDYRVDNYTKLWLEELSLKGSGFEIIYTTKCDYIIDEVNGHPDMIACSVNNMTVFEPRLFELYKERLKAYNIISGNKFISKDYPDDVAYNIAVIGKFAIGKLNSIDSVLFDMIRSESYEFINVNQGYAKCSTAIVDENSIITADKSIAKYCGSCLDVMLIEQDENIKLGNMYGFIGGASFRYGDKLVFFGDYKTHRSKEKIEDFCKARGVVPVSIGEGRLKDYGGIVPLYKKVGG